MEVGAAIVWILRLSIVPLFSLLGWAAYTGLLLVERRRSGSYLLEAGVVGLGLVLGGLGWFGAPSVKVAYMEHAGAIGQGRVERLYPPLMGRPTYGMADISHRGVIEAHAVKLKAWQRLTPRDTIDVYYLADHPRDFVPVASEHRSTLLALFGVALVPANLGALVLALLRTVQLWMARKRRTKRAPRPAQSPERRPDSAGPPRHAPPVHVAPVPAAPRIPGDGAVPPPPEPSPPAWVRVASDALALQQRTNDPSDWVRVLSGDRFPALSARETADRVAVKFAETSPDGVAVVVLRIGADRQLQFEAFERWPASRYAAFGRPVAP